MRKRRHYTPEEIRFVKKHIRGRPCVEMQRLFNKRFSPRITLEQMKNLKSNHGLRNGAGRFQRGHVPWNKDKRPIGAERINSGYVEIKTGRRAWERKHAAIWKKANGKVPKGSVIIFADGNKRNFALDNLLPVSRAELVVMNSLGLISANKALTVAGKTVADLKMRITDRKRAR